eukprot:2070137-Rhodomonas_salina.1
MLECGEASGNGAAAVDTDAKDVPANARPQEGGGAGGGAGGGGGGRSAVAKKRKPYQLGGRTLLLTEEEKSIYELTIGKQGVGQVCCSFPYLRYALSGTHEGDAAIRVGGSLSRFAEIHRPRQ